LPVSAERIETSDTATVISGQPAADIARIRSQRSGHKSVNLKVIEAVAGQASKCKHVLTLSHEPAADVSLQLDSETVEEISGDKKKPKQKLKHVTSASPQLIMDTVEELSSDLKKLKQKVKFYTRQTITQSRTAAAATRNFN
jgi:hypothetical protein